ncbi:hypothetical protein HNP89_000610 [Methanococcus maripaludis]|uniref:Uncharacterized protein n=1 Tax=Methanococcus maripaludis TaxID=39152 RepID=A0A7J9P009_METMI|nr:hypothetical protein [Methanococcus maripaludis]MBA2852673.1 hypothetical protein [Methanococcus maripaludis]
MGKKGKKREIIKKESLEMIKRPIFLKIYGLYFILLFMVELYYFRPYFISWIYNLSGGLINYFICWLLMGVTLVYLLAINYLKNFVKEPGRVIVYSGFLILIWVILGAQVLNLSYWGTVADWFSGIGLVILTAYLVQETINQRKSMEKQLDIMSKQMELDYSATIMFDIFHYSLYTQSNPVIKLNNSVKISMDTLSAEQLSFRPIIKNTGKFPVHNFKINYIFDYENFQKDILELNDKLGNPLKIEFSEPKLDVFQFGIILAKGLSNKIITLPNGNYSVTIAHIEPNISKDRLECSAHYYSIYYNTWLLLKSIEFAKSSKKPWDTAELAPPSYNLGLEIEYVDKLKNCYEMKAVLYSNASVSYITQDKNTEYNINGFWRFDVISYEKKNKI